MQIIALDQIKPALKDKPAVLEAVRQGFETISIVDLTGLGAQDLAIASMVYNKMEI